jgi:hypothetical protein
MTEIPNKPCFDNVRIATTQRGFYFESIEERSIVIAFLKFPGVTGPSIEYIVTLRNKAKKGI